VNIKKGDRIEIKIRPWEVYTGTVLEATNWGDKRWNPEGSDDWHIVFKHDRPQPGHSGPGSWKQRQDGGTVRVI
jgi:hypothetical protein